jgi:ankyrin repeat protein
VRLVLQDSKTEVDVADANGWSALHHAAAKGHTTVVQLLLDARAAVNAAAADGCTALHRAACNGHTAVVQLLLDAGADITVAAAVGGRTAMSLAAAAGHSKVVQLLLAAKQWGPTPQLATGVLADAAGVAATAGHAELAIMVCKALMAQDLQAAQQELASCRPSGQALAAQVLRQW